MRQVQAYKKEVPKTLYELKRTTLLIEPLDMCAADAQYLLTQMPSSLFYHHQTVQLPQHTQSQSIDNACNIELNYIEVKEWHAACK